jgi:hypothetical protein
MPRIEAVKARLDKVPAILKRFRQSVLTAAVTGKLTEQWREEHPEVESAEVLLERITGLKFFEIKEYPYDLPEEWLVAGFYDVAIVKSNLVDPKGFQNHPHIAPDNIERKELLMVSGKHDLAPGKRGLAPGKRGLAPGKQGLAPGKQGLAPGKQGLAPGKQGLAPGKQGLASGKQGLASGKPGARKGAALPDSVCAQPQAAKAGERPNPLRPRSLFCLVLDFSCVRADRVCGVNGSEPQQ